VRNRAPPNPNLSYFYPDLTQLHAYVLYPYLRSLQKNLKKGINMYPCPILDPPLVGLCPVVLCNGDTCLFTAEFCVDYFTGVLFRLQ
jgi:hypothetical protein